MQYLIIAISIVAFILALLYLVIRIYLRINNKGYEKTLQKAFHYDTNDKTDSAIVEYLETIKSTKEDNPVLINTYLLLSRAYQSKGPLFYDKALGAIDNAIKLLENKNVNQEDVYLKSALVYKAQFLKETGHEQEFLQLTESILEKYPADSSAKRRLINQLQ